MTFDISSRRVKAPSTSIQHPAANSSGDAKVTPSARITTTLNDDVASLFAYAILFPNLRSDGAESPNVVPSTAVMTRFAVPVVVNLTVQSPPTVGYDCTLMIVI